MADDWQVGDKAICAELNPQAPYGLGALRVGGVYTVTEVETNWFGLSLGLAEACSEHPTGQYRAFRFRKVLPDAHEACEGEFVTLLKRLKRPVSA